MTTLTKPTPQTYANSSWTMAIAAQPSALSRWWGQSLSQVSGFTLHLKPIEAWDAENAEDAELPQGHSVVIQGNQAELEGLAQLTEQYVQSWLGRSLTASSPEMPHEKFSAFWDDVPEWQSDTAYSHRLSLGALKVEPILRDLKVTTTQLYDLAEILQQSLLEVQALPSEFARALPERSLNWGKTAAVAAVALSLTGGLAWMMGGNSVFETASDPESEEIISLNSPQNVAPGDGPSGDNPLTLPPIQVKPTTPPISSKSSKTTIAQQVKPPPSPETKVKTTVDSVPAKITQQKLAQSEAGKKKVSENESASIKQQTSQKTSAAQKSSEKLSKPPQSVDSDSVAKTGAVAVKPKIEGQAEPPEVEALADAAAGTNPVEPSPQAAQAPPVLAESTPSPTNQVASAPRAPQAAAAAPDAAKFARPSGALSGLDNRRASARAASSASVLRFFQSQWQGQDNLDQNLLYRIVVKPDGSVLSVTPQNEVASSQFAQAPLPSPGDRLTPPFAGANVAFDVTLSPDGTVSVK